MPGLALITRPAHLPVIAGRLVRRTFAANVCAIGMCGPAKVYRCSHIHKWHCKARGVCAREGVKGGEGVRWTHRVAVEEGDLGEGQLLGGLSCSSGTPRRGEGEVQEQEITQVRSCMPSSG